MASFIKPSPLPASMHGMEIRDKRLVLAELPLPQIKPDELLIQVAYTGINRADVMQRDGMYAPPEGASPLPGLEVSGTVAQVGAKAGDWKVGRQVCALLGGGGYAEYAAVPASQVLPVPQGLSLQQAACLPEAAATAMMALLLEAALQPGERVLMHGGTSGLGILLTQIAHSLGAEVFATVGSDEKVRFLSEFGITAINHRSAPFAAQVMERTQNEGVDVVIDTLGAPHIETHFKLLRRGGRMVSLAMMDGASVDSFKMARLLTHHLRWSGTTLRSRSAAEKAQIMDLVRLQVWPPLAAGRIRPAIAGIFPLKEAEKAFESMQERLHLGKILLEVASK